MGVLKHRIQRRLQDELVRPRVVHHQRQPVDCAMDWAERRLTRIRADRVWPVDARAEPDGVLDHHADDGTRAILPRAIELSLLFVVTDTKPGTSVPGSFIYT